MEEAYKDQGYVPFQPNDDSDQTGDDEQQTKQYELLEKLQELAQRLPMKTQQRLSHTLLSDIAAALLDNAIFTIVNDLQEIQHLTEKNSFNQRQSLLVDHRGMKNSLKAKQLEELQTARSHNIALIKAKHTKEKLDLEIRLKEELQQMDQRLLQEFDQKVMGQQATLSCAGVPGFFVTNEPKEIKLQMVILQLVTDLASS